jgi:hypothetical protein
MEYLGYSRADWDMLYDEDKAAQKASILADARTLRTMYLKRLSKDMHTIKSILVFYLIASIFAVILAFILS